MNDSSSTERERPVSGDDNHQRQKMTKTTRSLGIVLVMIGLFVALAVPAIITQQGQQQAESYVTNFSRGGSLRAQLLKAFLDGTSMGVPDRMPKKRETLDSSSS